jgi:hypothetical protein
MHGTIAKSGRSKPLVLTGHFVYNSSSQRSRGTVHMSDPYASDSPKLEAFQDGTMMYMRSSRFGPLPEGREWMGLDLALGDELDSSVPTGVDAQGTLANLELVTGGVQKVGKESVRGVATTRYRGRISVSETAERLRDEGADDSASLVEKEGSPMQIEAWIDAEGLVRRMRVVQTKPGEEGEGPTTIDMRIDLFDFGIEPEIELPDDDEVFDATSVVREQAEAD